MYPTEATELVQQPLSCRRHTDPPRFWWRMAGGSVALHLLVVAIALPLIRASISAQSAGGRAGDPVAVDLLEVDAGALEAIASRDYSAQGNSSLPDATVAPAAPVPQAAVAQPPAPEFIPASPAENPTPSEPLEQTPQQFADSPPLLPEETSEPPLQEQTPPQTTPPLQEQPPPQTTPPLQQQAPPPETTVGGGNNSDSPLSSDAEGGIGDDATGRILDSNLIALPAPPDLNQPGEISGGGDGADLPLVNPNGTNSGPGGLAPVSYVASINATAIPLEERPTDIPDVPASPVSGEIRFSAADAGACQTLIDPMVMNERGASVSFDVVVEASGTVSEAIVRESGGSQEYANLARCLVVEQLQFNPATTEGIPRADNVIVTVTIN